jgi:rod shape-determining protein MreD
MAGIWCGFFVGLLIYVFSAGILGANALAKTLIGGCAGFLERKNILIEPILLLILLLFVLIIHDIIIYIPNIYAENASAAELPRFLFFNSLPRAIYTVATATILFIISDLLFALKIRR